MRIAIINRGRGPEIAGTRITVYDIMDYASSRSVNAIATQFRLSTEQVQCALQYIEKNKEEVAAAYRSILDRDTRGNSPEVRAKRKTSRAKLQSIKKKNSEATRTHERTSSGS